MSLMKRSYHEATVKDFFIVQNGEARDVASRSGENDQQVAIEERQ